MPLTSRPGEMAGNIPLILLASDTDGTQAHHPYARPSYTDTNTWRPCITSALNLGGNWNVSTPRTFALWLPTPTFTGHEARRRLFVSYDLTVAPQTSKVACPRFQVWAASQPSRSGAVETKFSSWPAKTKALTPLFPSGWSHVDPGPHVVEIPRVSAPGDSAPGNSAIDPEAMCFLWVRMPSKGDYWLDSMIFRLLGVAVEQW